ncbi:hypothetical protein DL546_007599 [Coniochaeta pulveracea]|uniref:F-box domain-containing protein n=1 Tax=Coniochaeta pulveracea TaxID=177199 RepID=A0A420YLS1_9PEZI|nr:hypothetical protein DL546_007599 [Coniochaeta pulveracea]
MALTTINSLPNEILLSILPHLSTTNLLHLLPLSHRFYRLILTLLHDRLLRAAAMPKHRLTLECYTPDTRLIAPSFYCDYLHTDPLSTSQSAISRLSELSGLYSHFKPTTSVDDSWKRWSETDDNQPSGEKVVGSGTIHLDESALFAQLCAVTSLVKLGPRRGLFLSHVNVGEGLIRVWRDWLAARARAGDDGGEVLWADSDMTVGIRVGLVEAADTGVANFPVFVSSEEDLPVSYRLEYSEVLVRTRWLLRMLEKSETQERTSDGKAVVLAM